MTPVVEAVPNFSEGRDPAFADAVAAVFARAGCEVFHVTADPDHHRSVVTVAGPPRAVEEGSVAAAKVALQEIDMRRHRGVHPRVGAMDVLPFVPLHDVSMGETARLARRTGRRIAALGIPVYFYAHASTPPGRQLASIRRGGFEALATAAPSRQLCGTAARARPAARQRESGVPGPTIPRREADLPGRSATGELMRFAHPTAGAVCVGARPVLLAWNVDLEGVSEADARSIAAAVRESGGGFVGLRALGVRLPKQGRLQVSMNLEDPGATDPATVVRAIERLVAERGGRVAGAEVIGMIPDPLSSPSAAQAARVVGWSEERLLGRRVAAYLASAGLAGREADGAGITFRA